MEAPQMVTVLENPQTTVQPQAGVGGHTGRCEDCPRCQDPQAGLCTYYHRQFNGLHPVCKVCGHCVLRGSHDDDASDLDNYPPAAGGGKSGGGPSLN